MKSSAVGYSASKAARISDDNLLQYVGPSDLRSYGLIPELIGRFPVLTYLDPLDREPAPHPHGAEERLGEAIHQAL